MAELVTTHGAVVAFPQAVVPHGGGFDWDHEVDTPYLTQLIDELRERYLPGGERVCLAGMSGGARMSCHVAWARSDLVGVVGAVAGLRAPPGPLPRGRAVSVVAFHGTADSINPYLGGRTDRWLESVPEAADRWAAANDVAGQQSASEVSRTLTCTRYGAEGQPGEVVLYTFKGAGHVWPGGSRSLLLRLFLGRPTGELDATAEISKFARLHEADR
jgi:polyhydroxybutyrate depolymerase